MNRISTIGGTPNYLKFPLQITNGSFSTLKTDDEFFEQNVKLFFQTIRGSRLWDSSKGSRIMSLIGGNISPQIVKETVTSELIENFPTISILNVSVKENEKSVNSFVINIVYRFSNLPSSSSEKYLRLILNF